MNLGELMVFSLVNESLDTHSKNVAPSKFLGGVQTLLATFL
jgi:hypothetical protein